MNLPRYFDETMLLTLLEATSFSHLGMLLLEEWLGNVITWGVIYQSEGDVLVSSQSFHSESRLTTRLKQKLKAFPVRITETYGVARVWHTGQLEHIESIPHALLPQLFPQAQHVEHMEALGYSSSLTLPFIYNNNVFAVLQLVRDDTQTAFSEHEAAQIQTELKTITPYLWHMFHREQQASDVQHIRREKRRALVDAYRYQERLEHYPLSTMILSHEGYTLAVNKAFNDFWGIGIEDDVAYNVSLFEDAQLRASGFLPIFERALAGEQVTGPPTFYDASHTKGGQGRWFRHMISPITRPDRRVREIIVVHVPLANEEQLEAMRRLAALGVDVPEAKQTTAENNPLSPRERSVLLLISEGCTNKEIADVLGISGNTVKFHITSLFNKLGVNSRANAVSVALEKKFI